MLPKGRSSGREIAAKEEGAKGLRLINGSSKTLWLSGRSRVEAEGTECVL
jgi:hypothetical protein